MMPSSEADERRRRRIARSMGGLARELAEHGLLEAAKHAATAALAMGAMGPPRDDGLSSSEARGTLAYVRNEEQATLGPLQLRRRPLSARKIRAGE
jgi:hypothetical protein